MSSAWLSVLPPYAMPFTEARGDGAARRSLDPFAATAARRVPYVPPAARLVAATPVIDGPDESALVPGARTDPPWRAPVIWSFSAIAAMAVMPRHWRRRLPRCLAQAAEAMGLARAGEFGAVLFPSDA